MKKKSSKFLNREEPWKGALMEFWGFLGAPYIQFMRYGPRASSL